MQIQQLRELLDLLEQESVTEGFRVCIPLDPKLAKILRKDYLVVLEESAWGQELILTEKLTNL